MVLQQPIMGNVEEMLSNEVNLWIEKYLWLYYKIFPFLLGKAAH